MATWCKQLTHWKRPWCWERLGTGGEQGDIGWDSWMALPTQWTRVCANSGSDWTTTVIWICTYASHNASFFVHIVIIYWLGPLRFLEHNLENITLQILNLYFLKKKIIGEVILLLKFSRLKYLYSWEIIAEFLWDMYFTNLGEI